MPKEAYIAIIITIPFLGTTLGALMVYFLKKELNPRLKKALMGFAGGVMVSASFFSLLLPSLELSGGLGNFSFVPSLVGFAVGIGLMFLIDSLLPHLHPGEQNPEGLHSKASRTTMMVTAVTIHNFPEGLAVGVGLLGALLGSEVMTLTSALTLSLGIALQNFPEGAIVSMPLASEGHSKNKSFLLGTLSGVVEPLGALLALALSSVVEPALPYLLSFAAGAMVYVVVEELIPEASEGEHSNLPTLGFAFGFALMMVLDVALG